MSQEMAPSYRVITVNAGCGGNVSPGRIEQECNRMTSEGYHLALGYEAMTGCMCQGKSAVLVFSR